jgi:hypothetical protein
MPSQALNLVAGIERDLGNARYASEWKYASILIGGNNLCLVCNPAREAANNDVVYETNLRAAFTTLQTLPRAVIGTVRVFGQNFALEDAIGSHACSLQANMCVTNDIPLGSPLLLSLPP